MAAQRDRDARSLAVADRKQLGGERGATLRVRYILVAVLAFIVAIFRDKVAPDMLTTLPMVAFGLGGAIATAYFGRK